MLYVLLIHFKLSEVAKIDGKYAGTIMEWLPAKLNTGRPDLE